MKKKLAHDNILEVCDGYIFLDCAIRSPDIVYIMARTDLNEDDAPDINNSQIPTRVILLNETNDNESLLISVKDINNFAWPVLGVSQLPVSQALLAANDYDGTVLPMGRGKAFWNYEVLHKNAVPQCKRLRIIDGYTWAVGLGRHIYKRIGIGQWISVNDGIVGEFSLNRQVGFEDIDGFSENEIYAAGGRGDIWKYNGKQWRQCVFPTNDLLYTVCCAKDGYVYIGARNGLWQGKDDQWKQLCSFDLPDEMNDLRWFNGQLWLAYDYTLLCWDGQKLLHEIVYQENTLNLGGFIDSSEDMLLVACSYEAWTFDGKNWCNIIPNFN